MNTFQLTCFLTIAETLSFAKTARQLNITQPAVTHQIHALEEELHTQLFRRTTRNVEITPEGLTFLSDARNVLNILNSAKRRFEEPAAEERQPFPIGCHSQRELQMLPDVLRGMAERFPALYPILQVVPFQHLYQLLNEGAVEVVISFQENGQKKGLYKEILRVPAAAVLSVGHPLAQREVLSSEDLQKEKLVLIKPPRCPDILHKIQHKLAAERAMVNLFFCDSGEACATLVRAGLGVAVMPDLPILKDPALVYVPLRDVESLSYGAYYKNLSTKPMLKYFLQLFQKIFSGSESPYT